MSNSYDLLIIGGGINGVGIARDASGRKLSVLLVEQDDLAAHTSSASTKLVPDRKRAFFKIPSRKI
ncbi:FAD-dependent oxidoreductase [Acidithiobacillus albertensis]|uniref:FAD-dependent oxidoreductase n=1 Tax=Acidithiobacillus albertensis TaxID=119978 RepID=UPI0029C04D21|nr:FAD-dependent oxidoreductase [Acidithiobacillus albertensis]